MLPGEITRIIAADAIDVAGDTAGSENDTSVLQGAIGIPQPCACHSDTRSRNLRHEFDKAIRVHDFNVVIEKKKD